MGYINCVTACPYALILRSTLHRLVDSCWFLRMDPRFDLIGPTFPLVVRLTPRLPTHALYSTNSVADACSYARFERGNVPSCTSTLPSRLRASVHSRSPLYPRVQFGTYHPYMYCSYRNMPPRQKLRQIQHLDPGISLGFQSFTNSRQRQSASLVVFRGWVRLT